MARFIHPGGTADHIPARHYWKAVCPLETCAWVMGFAHHPGALPFVTLRGRDKWAPRLAGKLYVNIVGERGCDLRPQLVRVASVSPYLGEVPSHLTPQYVAVKDLIAVGLEALLPGWQGV